MKKIYLSFSFIFALIFTYNMALAKITVKSVKGEVAYKKGRQWKPLKKGQALAEGTKISTGVRSSAKINIDGHNLTIKQLTMMKVFRSRTTKKKRSTHLGLKFGGLRARVKRIKRLKTSFKITTPVATSSVRGTDESNFYGSKIGMILEVNEGNVDGEDPDGTKHNVSGRQKYHKGTDKPRPDNLLSNVRDASRIRLYSDGSTDDEKDSHEFNGDELIDNSESSLSFLDSIPGSSHSREGSSTTSVTVDLQWEGSGER